MRTDALRCPNHGGLAPQTIKKARRITLTRTLLEDKRFVELMDSAPRHPWNRLIDNGHRLDVLTQLAWARYIEDPTRDNHDVAVEITKAATQHDAQMIKLGHNEVLIHNEARNVKRLVDCIVAGCERAGLTQAQRVAVFEGALVSQGGRLPEDDEAVTVEPAQVVTQSLVPPHARDER